MVRLKITNLREFAARLSAGARNLSKATFKHLQAETKKFFEGLPDRLATHPEFIRLKQDEELRGKLGLAKVGLKFGSDTDAEDLIKELKRIKVTTRINKAGYKYTVTFPTLDILEQKLTHNLSKVDNGVARRGPRQSWFRWWEFGDRGEISSLTILRKTITKLIERQEPGKRVSRSQLLAVLRKRSRSGAAIQLIGRRPDNNSSIPATSLVQTFYGNYAQIYPARMGLSIKRFVSRNGGRAEKFFARGVLV